MKKILTLETIKKSFTGFMLLAFVVSSVGISGGAFGKVANAATNWNVSGSHVLTMSYEGTDYAHDVIFVQDNMGDLTGSGSHAAYTWVITDGEVVNDTISFTANYTATPDAVIPQTVLEVDGTIALDGSISGTWSDNYNGGSRAGAISTVAGVAEALMGTLAAEDFGVVDYDTGLGQLRGYSAGFGLTDATFSGAQSVVVKLYATGDQLLQTNTLIGAVPGNQISAPFDVSGNFDYATDGYWTNVRAGEYGQSVPATKVVAMVTLANGKAVTAENTNLTGDPATIYPVAANVTTNPATTITQTNATLNGTNGNSAASGHSFWASLNTFSTAIPVMPVGVYSTPDLGAVAANTAFSSTLSSTGITVTPNTTYYFAAWVNVDGTWYPGEVLSFTTSGLEGEVIGGNGVLAVTSIEMTDSSATANNSYEDGWEYVFHITVPTDENDISMKFDDWMRTGGGDTIPAGGNMRISSSQANNGGATVPITAEDTYSTPALTMTTDLNPSLDGIQVEVVVEVKIPTGTMNGSYTTSYGVKSE